MNAVELFSHIQPGIYLTWNFEVCGRINAAYYVEADLSTCVKIQEQLESGRRKVLFFRIRHVEAGCVQTTRPYLFLKLLLGTATETEASAHREITRRCSGLTPNIITTHNIKVVEQPGHSLQFMLMELGAALHPHMQLVSQSCTSSSECVKLLLSCFFQVLHGVGTLHSIGFQHRDIRLPNIVSAYCVRSPFFHYLIDGEHYSVPVEFHSLAMAPMLVDFGLSEFVGVNETIINNVESSLAPEFVFISGTLEYTNSDEVFGVGLTLLYLTDVFHFPILDRGMLYHIQCLYISQLKSANATVFEHLNSRSFEMLARHAVQLVLLMGFPTPTESPAFHASPVGKYLLQIDDYIRDLKRYNFLAQQDSEPMVFLRSLLRWRRSDRPTATAALQMPCFDQFKTTPTERCEYKQHYQWKSDENDMELF